MCQAGAQITTRQTPSDDEQIALLAEQPCTQSMLAAQMVQTTRYPSAQTRCPSVVVTQSQVLLDVVHGIAQKPPGSGTNSGAHTQPHVPGSKIFRTLQKFETQVPVLWQNERNGVVAAGPHW